MTENQRNYERAICEIAGVSEIGEVSDGFHTFNSLYHQRAVLFAALVNQNSGISWKTRRHEDGEPCFGGGWFLVTIETPDGAYGYHYEDKYWDLFRCEEIEKAKPWDGYTDKDAMRLMSLPTIEAEPKHGRWKTKVIHDTYCFQCSACNSIYSGDTYYCPHCGAKMDGGAKNG